MEVCIGHSSLPSPLFILACIFTFLFTSFIASLLFHSGPGWTPGLTLSSVLLSIQTLLCSSPMLNEPGYENHTNATEIKAYNDIIRHETLRVALVANVKAILNGTSCIPSSLHELILARVARHLLYLTATCEGTPPAALDGKSMNDPFGERRGKFAFAEVLRQFCQLLPAVVVWCEERGQNMDQKIDVIQHANIEKEEQLDEEQDETKKVEEKDEIMVVDGEKEEDNNEEEECVPDELKCGVCFDILATPAVLECGHVFCYLCALRW